MKKQVIVIHGGNTYDSYRDYIKALKKAKIHFDNFRVKRWKENLGDDLGRRFEVIAPSMPNAKNAKYLEWKIWFEKLIPYFDKKVVLVGHSLGGIFLAKYLSENKFPKKITGIFIVAAPSMSDRRPGESLADFVLSRDMTGLDSYGDRIHLYYSTDDELIRPSEFNRYLKFLPKAKVRIFKNRGHFLGDKFPELVKDIKALYK